MILVFFVDVYRFSQLCALHCRLQSLLYMSRLEVMFLNKIQYLLYLRLQLHYLSSTIYRSMTVLIVNKKVWLLTSESKAEMSSWSTAFSSLFFVSCALKALMFSLCSAVIIKKKNMKYTAAVFILISCRTWYWIPLKPIRTNNSRRNSTTAFALGNRWKNNITSVLE